MSAKFPHLDDTKFPGVHTVDPYRFKNNFDYSRWEPGTRLKLCNVNWCGDYENVVKFEDDAARDKYFDTISGEFVELQSAMRILPGQAIKLPVPFDELVRYNYLMADFSTATSDANPINYETAKHLRRFYFFVRDVRYLAPNSTECVVELDTWTTYINRISIQYMMLERGHAPLAATDVDTYLANPVNSNRYLLADDFTFGEPAITKSSDFVPFGSGEKYVLLASTIPADRLDYIGETGTAVAETPRFSSDTARNGYEAIVKNMSYGAGGVDYSNLELPTAPTVGTATTANGYTVYAVRATDVFRGGFFESAVAIAPQFIESIAGVFVVDDSMIVRTSGHKIFQRRTLTWRELANIGPTWAAIAATGATYAQMDARANDYFGTPRGFDVFEVQPRNGLLKELKLTKEQFNYPPEYADLAKLYTFPYAAIEIADADGNAASLRIEETGALELAQRVSLAYPYIRFEAFLYGVGSNSTNDYVWKSLTGADLAQSIPAGAFRDMIFGYDIPAFSIFMSGYDAYRLHNYNANNTAPAARAALDYENTARAANTAFENALDNAETAYQNARSNWETSRENAGRSANTSLDNAHASNATAYTNTEIGAANTRDTGNASALTALTNTTASADTALANANTSNATGFTNASRSAELAKTNTNASAKTALDNSNRGVATGYINAEASAALAKSNTANANKATTANTALSNAASVSVTSATNANSTEVTRKRNELNQAMQAWAAGFSRELADLDSTQMAVAAAGDMATSALGVAAGALGSVGATTSAVVGGANALLNTVQSGITAGINKEKTEKSIVFTQAQVDETTNNSTQIMQLGVELATTNTTTATQAATAQTKNTVDASNANAQSSYNVGVANAGRSRDTTTENATATYKTTGVNAQRSEAIAVENAGRTRDTGNATAARTRDTGVTNARRSRDTTSANLADNYATAVATAGKSRDTANANAERTYDTALDIADANRDTARLTAGRTLDNAESVARYSRDQTLENAQRTLRAQPMLAGVDILDRKLDRAVEIGARSGDPIPDEFAWRGLQVRVVTQTEGAIAQAGDAMLRYGYALNQMWAYNGFCVMPKFSFWKCSDLWLCGDNGVIEGAQEKIKNILKHGVTVWSDPEAIGRTSIYENHR